MRHLLLLLALLCANAGAADFFVRNSHDVSLHTIDDYLALIPEQALGNEARITLRQKATTSTADQVARNGDYKLTSDFQGENVSVLAELTVVHATGDASKVMSKKLARTYKAIADNGLVSRDFPCPAQWVEECRFIVVGSKADPAIGDSLYVRRGRAIYTVQILGLGGLDQTKAARDFLGAKAEAALAFLPFAADLKPKLSESEEAAQSGRDMASTILFLLLYSLAYHALYWATKAVNRISKKALLRPRAMGLGAVALLATAVYVYARYFVVSQKSLEAMSEYDLKHFTGTVIGFAFFPALIVFIAVAYGAGTEKTPPSA